MDHLKEATAEENTRAAADGGGDGGVVVELPLGDAASSFDLEKAVCSHGLFMMAPNHWDPLTKTLKRPLRIDDEFDDSVSHSVHISHPSDSPLSLHIRVLGTECLSPQRRKSLLDQVRRMLRLSDREERNVREFRKIYGEAEERGFGRVFRSPTLFEDMVKCMLLCNCQWPRTLSMARALCELQFELQSPSFSSSVSEANNIANWSCETDKTELVVPKTPIAKELKRTLKRKRSTNLESRFAETETEVEEDDIVRTEEDNYDQTLAEFCKAESLSLSCCCIQSSERTELHLDTIGDFPSPRELASLDENFLAKRCKLGYRARRIVNLAKSVVEGRIQLSQLEEASQERSLSNYDKMAETLKEINGFGAFTCNNVLMCMGFYHVIPTDSETIRHLQMVHARNSTIKRIQQDVEAIYGKYAPFQFLAYWSEIWQFYEEKFGKLSEMPHSDYKLITATNMRPRANGKNKRAKRS